MNAIIIFTINIILIILLLIYKKKLNVPLIIKILSLCYFIFFIISLTFNDYFIWVINGGKYNNIFYKNIDYRQSFIRWGNFITPLVFVMASFFNSKIYKNIVVFITPIFTLLTIIMYKDFMYYYTTNTYRGIYFEYNTRSILFSLNLILSLLIPLIYIFIEKYRPNFKDKKEITNTLILLFSIIILVIPVYLPQSLFGYSNTKIDIFSTNAMLWMFISILLIYILYLIFRFKDYRSRYMLVMCLSLALFLHYNSMFLMGVSIKRLPLQLCNLGAYFFTLALIIKKRPFFDFILITSTTGSVVAMLFPDMSGGILQFWNIHFIFEHTLVFIVPFLILLLRIMPRTNLKSFKNAFVGFSIYYFSVFIIGTILNGYLQENDKVNYFFIFDLEKAEEFFFFVKYFEKSHIILFNRFEIFPQFQIFIFIGFTIFLMLFTIILNPLYQKIDDNLILRKSRINLLEKLTNKKYKGPLDYQEDSYVKD